MKQAYMKQANNYIQVCLNDWAWGNKIFDRVCDVTPAPTYIGHAVAYLLARETFV